MADSVTISKNKSSFPDYLDFQKLRAAGLEHIQALGSDLWTDYNLHDPGITILEVLCYALTDLGFRTNFDIKDLLTRSSEAKALDAATDTPDGKLYDDNFYTAEQILTCNPVTLLDLRKLLIDIPGVRNAWLERATEAEVTLYINEKKSRLQYTLPKHIDETDPEAVDEATVRLKGLYTVCLDLDAEPQRDACGQPDTAVGDILEEVSALLHRHRNLCEDFLDVVVLGHEAISLCADVELRSEADPEDVLLGIHTAVQEFLSPTFQFYSLQEMLARGKSVEAIFEGRPLSPQSHGFIDVDELARADLRETLHASDLYQEIMDVEGVLAIRKLVFANYVNDLPQTRGEKWCLKLTPKHRPSLDLDKSKITFYKGLLPFTADKKAVERRYQEEKAASTKGLQDPNQLDLPVPTGVHHDLQDYYSIQHEFPLVYGIGEEGLRPAETQARKAQARQLKAYLLFFDQILANYLAQLAHLRELFSMRPDDDAHRLDGNNRTYFTQLLEGVPRVEELILNFNDCPGNEGYLAVPEDYPEYLNYIAESIETYHDRRNRFLDHLMSRFAESFTDYVLLMYNINGKRNDNERIIQDKTDFLGSYPEISRNRGKAFNYKETPVWDTENVSGLQKRVSKLVGIDDVSRRDLSHCDIVTVGAAWHFVLNIPDAEGGDPFRLESKQGFADEDAARDAYEDFLALARDEANYQRLAYEDATTRYGFIIIDANGTCVAESPERFITRSERDQALFDVINYTSGSGIICTVEQTQSCYDYQVYDASGTVLLFVAAHGEPTAEAAQEAYATVFLPRARDASFYRDIDADGAFSFELMTEAGGDEPLARHPHTYATAPERDDRKQAVIYYLDEEAPRFGTDGPPGRFDFEVRDNAGTLLFVNSVVYPTEAAALEAYRAVVRQARFRVSYRLLDDLGEDAPFGFELLDRKGAVLAAHPTAYATDCARDLALDGIIHLLCEQDDIRFEVSEGEEGFTFVLLGLDGAPLFFSDAAFASEAEALAAFQAFLLLAADPARYTLLDDVTEEEPFGFMLTDEADVVIATHPASYALEAERALAVQSILHYVQPADLEFEVTGEVGNLHFVLLGEADRVLFKSIATYPDEETARQAFDDFVVLARERDHYALLPDFGFELRDGGGLVVAEHPQTYAGDEERDAAIALILAYLREDTVVFDVVNTQGAYFFEVQDEAGVSWLIGVQTHPGQPEAEAACAAALSLAQDEGNYHRLEDGPGNCSFGFALRDEADEVVARHPLGYTSEAAREAAIRHFVYTVLDGEILPDVVRPRGDAFGFELTDPAGRVLFESEQVWGEAAGAEAAFRSLLVPLAQDLARYALAYDNDACTYTFFLIDESGAVVASHPHLYTSRRERDAQVQAIIYFVARQDLACVIHGTDCGYYFRLEAPGEDCVFQPGIPSDACGFLSAVRYPDDARAASACNRVLPLLSERANYDVVETAEGFFQLVVQDAEGVEQAVYQQLEEDAEVLNTVADAVVAYVTQERELEHEIAEKEGGFRYQLEGPADEDTAERPVLFTSTVLYLTEDEAWDACNTFSERVQERADFRLITDRLNCLYGFELTDPAGQTLAAHTGFYPTAQERDAVIGALIDWVNDEGLHLVEHLLLRPRNKGGDPAYFFELIHDETEVPLFRSVTIYDDVATAVEVLQRLLLLLLTNADGLIQVYSRLTEGQRCHSFRLVDAGTVVADHEGFYDTEEDALAAANALAAYVWTLFQEVLDEDENLYGPADDLTVAIDTLAQVQLDDAMLRRYVGSYAAAQDLEPDGFLPVDECGFDDEEEAVCAACSDPYSFRATVVLPYWPERFRNVSFRNFFERTIRQETPAHIFLRICWVDVCQMRAFERAYRRWLQTLTMPDGDCTATAALNRLLDLISRLRNVYPKAILRGCDDGGDGAAIILNQTLLGNASFISDDDS